MSEKIIDIPFFRQIGPTCISASLCSILNYLGIKILPGRIAWEMGKENMKSYRKGVDLAQALSYLIHHWQLEVYPFISIFNSIIEEMIRNDIPLLVVQKTNFTTQSLHSRVLVGYGEEMVYLVDPQRGKVEMEISEFNQLSSEDGFPNQNIFVAISLYPLADYIDFFMNNPFYLNLKGVIKDLDEKDEALIYYDKSIKTAPHYADPYNNLALFYCRKGDYQNAQKYIQIALKLAPDEYPYQETLKMIEANYVRII